MIIPIVLISAVSWFFNSCQSGEKQISSLMPVGPLPAQLTENSGMAILDEDTYIGLNDSGSEAEVYVFSLKRKNAARRISIENAHNTDWEELATDDVFVYIGDTGNNDGNRKDLAIYRVRKDDMRTKDKVNAEKISYSYDTQTSFKASGKNNFDCESMICFGDSLYLFSKNRGNLRTDVFSLSKLPGTYKAKHLGQFEADGLVTSADFRKKGLENELVLVGYKNDSQGYHSFMIYFPHVIGTEFFRSSFKRVDFHSPLQIESIVFVDSHTVFISNESGKGRPGMVYQADLLK